MARHDEVDAPTDEQVLAAFLERYWKDQDARTVRPLSAYLAQFPDHEGLIAQEFMALEGGAAPPSPAPDVPTDGGDLGPYRILEELGRGGQGAVYLAEDTRLHRKVALKVLTALGPGSENTVERFRREAKVASKLEHPGICGVHDAGVANGIPYIAMQLVQGETLAERIAQSKNTATGDEPSSVMLLSETTETAPETDADTSSPSTNTVTKREIQDILRVFEMAARALHAAHEAGIIHRDIKPGNLMVTPEGQPVILDFGLARDTESDLQTLTRTGDMFGTPAYMSPEQLMARRIRLDRRTDVYSLGATLYECLTLRKPFEAQTREALYQAIMTRDAPDALKLNPALPTDLSAVLDKTLEKDRNRRYETALDFAEELRRIREYEPILAKPVTNWVRVKRWAQRNPGVAASLLLAFLFLMGGLVTAILLMQGAQTERDAKGVALQQEKQALNKFRQMSDVVKVEQLVEREKKLWPRRDHTVPEMDAWLVEAREMFGRLDSHRAGIAKLEAKAQDYTDEESDARKRRELHSELFKALNEEKTALAKLKEQLQKATSASRKEALEERKEDVEDSLAKLQKDLRLKERLTWRFDDAADAWRHQVLRQLVKDLKTFEATIKDIKARRKFALEVKAKTVTGEEVEKLWAACIANIAKSDKYSKEMKLALTPQVGLVPLGKDRDSALWEFWHPGSGEQPGWDGELLSGQVGMKAESGIVLVLIPGGTFWMGGQKDDAKKPNYDPQTRGDEGPVHKVELSSFFMGKHELTQGQWSRIMRERPRPSVYGAGMKPGRAKPITELNPVEQVSWEDCTEALKRWDLVLPTEAQWEYAARAGASTPWWCGDTVKSIQGKGNISDAFAHKAALSWKYEKDLDDGHVVHAPVGSFTANAFGLHDVLGNVWEWCRDRASGYDTKPRPRDGLRDSGDLYRVDRGGSFSTTAPVCRSASRIFLTPAVSSNNLGCRAARRITP